jgi:hypothetical protein
MEELGRLTFPNSRTASPRIDHELVITRCVSSNWGANGAAGDRFYAFDKVTGELVWSSSPGERPQDNTFSQAFFTWIDGCRALISAGGDSTIVGINARNGDPMFRFPAAKAGAKGGINAAILRYKDSLVVVHESENLDSSEVGHPPEKFKNVFALAHAHGLHLVAHAGEEGPPAYIWSALDVLHVERIDHGVQSVHDAALMARLAKERTPLTVCPLSNQKLCVFPDLKDHNIGQLLDAGLCVTINSDDPAYFGGYMNENFVQTFQATGLSAQQAYVLASNSFEASFASEQQKNQWLHVLKQTFQRFAEQD